jgi:hypothetical protein
VHNSVEFRALFLADPPVRLTADYRVEKLGFAPLNRPGWFRSNCGTLHDNSMLSSSLELFIMRVNFGNRSEINFVRLSS